MKLYNLKIFASIAFISIIAVSCKKQDEFLNAKPKQSLAVPSTLSDFEAILHQETLFNTQGPALGFISSGEFYVEDAVFLNLSPLEQNAYTWSKDVYQGAVCNDWLVSYQRIYYANTVLDGLTTLEVTPSQLDEFNQIKGKALFYRAWSIFNLVQTFSMPYDSVNSATTLGIPLRLNSDFNVKIERASQKQCYDQVITDLQNALQLLPNTTTFITQGSKVAAAALLARIYLAMGNYSGAFKYADSCIKLHPDLLNYNSVQLPGSEYDNPFSLNSSNYISEDLYHSVLQNYDITGTYRSIVDTSLYTLYDSTDLRKTFYFVLYNGARFKGSYDIRNGDNYDGLAIDEIYLIRAECYARTGDISSAMNDLNKLLINRYKTGTFTPRSAVDQNDALNQILLERRKELIFRGLRWTDLRRLNKDPRFAVTLTRQINGTTYTLPPNDPKYALPIPDQEIQLSGIQQNPR